MNKRAWSLLAAVFLTGLCTPRSASAAHITSFTITGQATAGTMQYAVATVTVARDFPEENWTDACWTCGNTSVVVYFKVPSQYAANVCSAYTQTDLCNGFDPTYGSVGYSVPAGSDTVVVYLGGIGALSAPFTTDVTPWVINNNYFDIPPAAGPIAQLTVVPGLPTLKLFLDVDGFDAANPTTTDDKGWYVPCTAKNGTSVAISALPQVIRVVAAYVRYSDGAVVAPPNASQAQIALSNVSRYKGIAMNASKAGRSDDALDFEAVSSTASFGSDNTARFSVNCWDYGGFGSATVTHNGQTSPVLAFPVDTHGNHIPDIGWLAQTAQINDTNLNPGDDEDNTPAVSGPPATLGLIGDGLVNFEEYRGFNVGGSHRRTNPFKKDLFVSSNLTTGIAFAFPNLPTATHRVNGEDEIGTDEYRTADRVINFNYQNTGEGGNIPNRSESTNQRALRVKSVPSSPQNYFGYTFPINPADIDLGTPNETLRIEVYIATHDNLKKAPLRYSNTQVSNEMKRTTGHEIGHGVSVCHRDSGPPCYDGAVVGTVDSIMSSALFGGPPETDPRSQYNSFDIAQIRLHIYR